MEKSTALTYLPSILIYNLSFKLKKSGLWGKITILVQLEVVQIHYFEYFC